MDYGSLHSLLREIHGEKRHSHGSLFVERLEKIGKVIPFGVHLEYHRWVIANFKVVISVCRFLMRTLAETFITEAILPKLQKNKVHCQYYYRKWKSFLQRLDKTAWCGYFCHNNLTGRICVGAVQRICEIKLLFVYVTLWQAGSTWQSWESLGCYSDSASPIS